MTILLMGLYVMICWTTHTRDVENTLKLDFYCVILHVSMYLGR